MIGALELVSLDHARTFGLVRYFTGKPCKWGHVAERATSNCTCVECNLAVQKEVYVRYSKKIKARVRAYVAANKEKKAASDKDYQQRNRERLNRYYSSRYYRKKPEILEKIRAYRKARPGFFNEVGKAYLLRKSKAMPPWVNRSELRALYVEAARQTRETGIVYSVDHIFPLKGKHSCGLHVPWNLQIITKIDNCRKATKTPEEWHAMAGAL